MVWYWGLMSVSPSEKSIRAIPLSSARQGRKVEAQNNGYQGKCGTKPKKFNR